MTKPWALSRLPLIDARSYGAVGDGLADDTQALRDAIAAIDAAEGIGALDLGAGHYKVTAQINVPHGFTIHSDNAVIDGSVGFSVADGLNVLNVGSETRTALPDLASDESQGEMLVSFVAPHGLAAGDVFAIYDPTDFSFSSARNYYRKGEFCEVAEVTSAVQVRLSSGLFDGYLAATVDCYKLATGTFTIIGELEVRASQPAPADATIGVRLNQVVRSDVGALRVIATGGAYAAILAQRCYKISLDYNIRQNGLSVGGDCYGLIWGNSQQCTGRGHASSSRHGVSHGGAGDPADVPTRMIHNEGTWETTGEGGVFSVDVHGICEAISFDGTARGGIDCGGKSVRFRGTIHADPTTGIAVYFVEVKQPNFDFAGVRIIGNPIDPNAAGRGLIDFGGNTTADCDNMLSGQIDFSGAVIDAPSCNRVLTARKRNVNVLAGMRHSISLRGALININPAAATPIYVDTVGAIANWRTVDMAGMDINTLAIDNVTKTDIIRPAALKGNAAITVTNVQASNSLQVNFAKAFPPGYIPTVSASSRANGANGALVNHQVHNVTAASFFITVRTETGANFGAGRTDTYDWTAA